MHKQFDLPNGRYITKNYKVLELLGKGWEGEVYKVEEQKTGIIRAAKLFYAREQMGRDSHICYAQKLYRLRTCPVIIQYHHNDTFYLKGKRVSFLVSDYVDGEVLSQYLERQRGSRFPVFEALHIFYAILSGIEHIHFLDEYHGDIHADNIIIKRTGLGFEIRFIDVLNLGRTTKDMIQEDVYDLIFLLYELIGGQKYYSRSPNFIKNIILGKRKRLIKQRYNMAGHLRLFIDNIEWS